MGKKRKPCACGSFNHSECSVTYAQKSKIKPTLEHLAGDLTEIQHALEKFADACQKIGLHELADNLMDHAESLEDISYTLETYNEN